MDTRGRLAVNYVVGHVTHLVGERLDHASCDGRIPGSRHQVGVPFTPAPLNLPPSPPSPQPRSLCGIDALMGVVWAGDRL